VGVDFVFNWQQAMGNWQKKSRGLCFQRAIGNKQLAKEMSWILSSIDNMQISVLSH
jgi:hypothetical protein